MAFCSSRLEPNTHTDQWGTTLTFPYHGAISAVSLTAAHSRGLWPRGTFPDKVLWWLLPKSVTFLWSFAFFNMRTITRPHKYTCKHTLNYLSSVPLNASLTLHQLGPNKPSQAGGRKAVEEGEEKRPKQLFSKHFTSPWQERQWNMICISTIQLWNILLKWVCFSFVVLYS